MEVFRLVRAPLALLIATICLVSNTPAAAQQLDWADFTAWTIGNPNGTAAYPGGGNVTINLVQTYTVDGVPVTYVYQGGYPWIDATPVEELTAFAGTAPFTTQFPGGMIGAASAVRTWNNNGFGTIAHSLTLNFTTTTIGHATGDTLIGLGHAFPNTPLIAPNTGSRSNSRWIVTAVRCGGSAETDYTGWSSIVPPAGFTATDSAGMVFSTAVTGAATADGYIVSVGTRNPYNGNQDAVPALVRPPAGSCYNSVTITRAATTTAGAQPGGVSAADTEYLKLYIARAINTDFDDAPGSYGSASHIYTTGELLLGSAVTSELATFDSATASADSDDAFVSLVPVNGSAATHSITVPVSGMTAAAQLCGYIDFNRDGDFADTDERACVNVAAGAASAALAWNVPTGTTYVAGNSYARFRMSATATEAQSPTGAATSGEVEDYTITLLPRVRLNKTLNPAADPGLFNLAINPTVLPAGTATATNVGNGGTTGFATMALGTTINFSETAGTGTSLAGFESTRVCVNRVGGVVLAAGAGATGSFGSMTSASTGGANATPATTANVNDTEIICTFTNRRLVADLQIQKTNTIANGLDDQLADTVVRGPTTYTLTVRNNGPDTVTGAVVTDAPGAGITCPAGNVTVVVNGVSQPDSTVATLTGAGVILPALAMGQIATLTVQCTVN